MGTLLDAKVAALPIHHAKKKNDSDLPKIPSPVSLYTHIIETPIGKVTLAINKRGSVHSIHFGLFNDWPNGYRVESNKYACGQLSMELDEYFMGKRRSFGIELAPVGTIFQRAVWERLVRIPFGSVVSYGEIARQVGLRGAARAVANAVATNPIPLLIPCHRVILATGDPGNYAVRTVPREQGCQIKRFLLCLEGLPLKP